MNKVSRFVLLSSVLALLGLNGCGSDAGSEAKPGDSCTDACTPDDKKCDGNAVYVCGKNEDTEDACYAWIHKETCSDGKLCDESAKKCVDDTKTEKKCPEEGCAEGQHCDESTDFKCVDDEKKECPKECDEGQHCDESTDFKCVDDGPKQCPEEGCDDGWFCDESTGFECVDEDPCPNRCDPSKEPKRCDGEDIYACQKHEDAEVECYSWVHETMCSNGQHCDETSFVCVDGCTEICENNQSTRCSSDGLEECKPDEQGCASWSVVDACEGGTCDSEKLKCVKSCDNECTVDEKKCDGNGIATCTMDADGCLIWGEPAACETGKTCEPATLQCEIACNSDCTEKDKKETLAASQKVCTDVNGKGCLQWVETKCKKGEKFDAKQNKCVSVCGNDCEPFSIVFLPDTQKYTRRLEKDKNGNIVKKDNVPDIFSDQLKWIKDYKDKYNIKAVIHLGDITDRNTQIAWQYASGLYAKYIDVMDLPYTVAPGNHDYLQCPNDKNDSGIHDACVKDGNIYARSATKFDNKKYGNFNNSRPKVKDRTWFKGYKNVGNSYITFKAANIDFLVIALEFLPRNEVIDWANDIISNHPNHKVIIETHAYLNPHTFNYCTGNPAKLDNGQYKTDSGYSGVGEDADNGFKSDANGGGALFTKLVAKHNNIILVANGHVSGSCFRLNKGNNGNTLAEMVVDYQSEDGIGGKCGSTNKNGGAGTGWFRMLTFNPKNYTITARSTSSLSGKKFAKGKEWFYCNKATKDVNGKTTTVSYYPQDPQKKPSYTLDMDSDAHRFTNHHAFVVNFDFVTPVDYIKP